MSKTVLDTQLSTVFRIRMCVLLHDRIEIRNQLTIIAVTECYTEFQRRVAPNTYIEYIIIIIITNVVRSSLETRIRYSWTFFFHIVITILRDLIGRLS